MGAEAAPADSNPASGLRVWIDPETGNLRSAPTARQRAALQALENASRAGEEPPRPRSFVLRDGTRGVFLDGAFQSALSVHQLADGSFHFGCQDTHAEADAAQPGAGVETAPVAADPPQEEVQ
jgi:hypothetical protein